MNRIWVGLALVVAVMVPGIRSVSAGQQRPTPARTYLVHRGDTLWSIAARQGLEGDRRKAVQRILELNHLENASLRLGQRLLLPLR